MSAVPYPAVACCIRWARYISRSEPAVRRTSRSPELCEVVLVVDELDLPTLAVLVLAKVGIAPACGMDGK